MATHEMPNAQQYKISQRLVDITTKIRIVAFEHVSRPWRCSDEICLHSYMHVTCACMRERELTCALLRDRGMHKEGRRKEEVAREEVSRCNRHIIDITSAIEGEKEQFTVKYPFPQA